MRKMRSGQCLFLKCIRALDLRTGAQRVPLHIKLRRGQDFGKRVSLVESFCLGKFRRQLRRHGRARFIMLRIVIEDSRDTWPSAR